VPEIAEREPKVISVGCVYFGGGFNTAVVCTRPAHRCLCPEEGFILFWAWLGVRKWCSLSRLETRTKESDTGASIEVANLSAQ
jgi:hypothetical protein